MKNMICGNICIIVSQLVLQKYSNLLVVIIVISTTSDQATHSRTFSAYCWKPTGIRKCEQKILAIKF